MTLPISYKAMANCTVFFFLLCTYLEPKIVALDHGLSVVLLQRDRLRFVDFSIKF